MLPYIKVDTGFQCIVEGSSYRVDVDHPQYDLLLEAVREGDADTFLNNITVEKAVQRTYSGTGVTVDDGCVYYNGEPVHNVICDRIIGFVEEGAPVGGMLQFLENLMDNPSKRSVDQLYRFLEHKALPITEDGCFLAYKTVRNNYLDKYSGKFDNTPGTVLEMPRNSVDDNPGNHCSQGFHVGALEYAGPNGWYNSGGFDKVVIVKVNPKDAVSVPTDHNCQKLRVCRYEVLCDYGEKLPDTYASS